MESKARMSNVGKWNQWYRDAEEASAYGDTISYQMCADYLQSCSTVEDWGCGKGWMRQFFDGGPDYIGIDGSNSPHADIIEDLCERETTVDGIILRHVLEHNHEWERILGGAIAGATQKIAVVLFTPLADSETTVIADNDIGVPDISFFLNDIYEPIGEKFAISTVMTFGSATQYGTETVILGEVPW